jgi:CheY-like chemotaxis protein
MKEVIPPLHILLIEDSRPLQELTLESLRDLGHQAVAVTSAELALEELEKTMFDVVIADVNLPGASGLSFAKVAGQRWPGLPVVISSGHAEMTEELLRQEFRQGIFALRKPYTLQSLEQLLMRVAKTRSARS